MFQFPGFALKTLCILVESTWLTPLFITEVKNNRVSGGFPHSDISGSKPIPGSPKLNAGYHVLHRLLLPRHPPNALFALDLIQEEHDRLQAMNPAAFLKSIACTFPPSATRRRRLASVLDLEQYHPFRLGCICKQIQLTGDVPILGAIRRY